MPRFDAQYKFNVEDKDYIRAIELYNKDMRVVSAFKNVDGERQAIRCDFKCQFLSKMLNQLKDKFGTDIYIICSGDERSLLNGIFPELLDLFKPPYDRTNRKEDPYTPGESRLPLATYLNKAQQKIAFKGYEIISTYLTDWINREENHANQDNIMPLPLEIASLNQDQLFCAFRLAAFKFRILGAIYLETINTILFELPNNQKFILSGTRIELLSGIGFDIDDGFSDILKRPEYAPLIEALQCSFRTWKENNRQEELFQRHPDFHDLKAPLPCTLQEPIDSEANTASSWPNLRKALWIGGMTLFAASAVKGVAGLISETDFSTLFKRR